MLPSTFYMILDKLKSGIDIEKILELDSDSESIINYLRIDAVDPATIAAIGKAGIEMISKYGDKKNQKALAQYFAKELIHIRKLLENAISILQEIKVLVINLPIDYTKNLINSTIERYSQSYESWLIDPKNRKVEARNLYNELRDRINVGKAYGYVHYSTIWMGNVVLLSIAKYLYNHSYTKEESTAFLLEFNLIVSSLQGYYIDALDPNTPGSIMHSLNNVYGEISVLEKAYPPGAFIWYSAPAGGNPGGYAFPQSGQAYEFKTEIIGSIKDGFTYHQQKPYRVSRRSVGAGNEKPAKTIQRYANAHYHYKTVLEPQMLSLQQAKMSLETYRQVMMMCNQLTAQFRIYGRPELNPFK